MAPQSTDQSQYPNQRDSRIYYNFWVILIFGIIGLILFLLASMDAIAPEPLFIIGVVYFGLVLILIGSRTRSQIFKDKNLSQYNQLKAKRIIYFFLKIIFGVIVGFLSFLIYIHNRFYWGFGEIVFILGVDIFLEVVVIVEYCNDIKNYQSRDVSNILYQRDSRIYYNFWVILIIGIIGLILFLFTLMYAIAPEPLFIVGVVYFGLLSILIGSRTRFQIFKDKDLSQYDQLKAKRIIYFFLKIIFSGIAGFLSFLIFQDAYYWGYGEIVFILGVDIFLEVVVIVEYCQDLKKYQGLDESNILYQRERRKIHIFLTVILFGIAGFLLFLLIMFLYFTASPGLAFSLVIILCVVVGVLLGYRKRIRISYRKKTAKRRVNRSLRYARAAQIQEEFQDFPSARKKWRSAENLLLKVSKKFPDYVTREYLIQNLGVIKKKIGISFISQGMQAQQSGWKHIQKGDFKKAKQCYYRAITIIEDAIRYIHNVEVQESSFTFPIKIDVLNEIIRFYRQNSSYFQKNNQRKTSSKNPQNIVDLSEFHQKIYESIQEFNHVLWIYDQVLHTMQTSPAIEEISSLIEQKIGKILNLLSNVQERTQILYNYTRTLGKSDLTPKLTGEPLTLPSFASNPSVDQETVETHQLKLIREYEFIGGRIRFKVGIQNQTGKVITNLALRFDLPDSLIWVLHEPNYTRRGDTIHIPKLGGHEKLAISLYLEPINCLDSAINATLTYFDADDHPNALVMPSKSVSVSCPIFFTREDANLARVKNLSLELKIKDRKIFPLTNTGHAEIIYNKLLETVGKHDVKLVMSEFNPTIQNGEAWFYGVTKIKQQKMVIWISLDPSRYVLELTVWGDDQEQITGLLAELEGQLRQSLLLNHIIDDSKKFNELSTSILLGNCPYCAAPIASELLQGYRRGETIQCKYCDKSLSPY